MKDNFDNSKWYYIRGCSLPAILLLMIAAIAFGA